MISDFISAFTYSVQSGLFVDELMHGFVSLPFVFLIYYKTKSFKYSIIPLIVVYVIDMDHWVDYVMYHGFDLSWVKFVVGEHFEMTKKAIVPFHAWEWFLALAALCLEKRRWDSPLTGVTLGIFAHLLWDSYTVGSVINYSILYRISNMFVIS